MIPAQEAFKKLQEGHQRFLSGTSSRDTLASQARRQELVLRQQPFAVILGCADSRIPPEVLFDQGLGDLFVVRIAGNIAASSQIGSIEYAVEQLQIHLVVVLGHTCCGAIAAAVEQIVNPTWVVSQHLQKVIDYIRPALDGALPVAVRENKQALAEYATRANVQHVVTRVQQESKLLATAVREKKLVIVGAEYSMETGALDFFDDNFCSP